MKDQSGGCSPCCGKKSDYSPPLLPTNKMPAYPETQIKPAQGTLPSSKLGFLVSFLVDARGGAMTGHRHWGMRVVIPPGAVQQPTRVNCRYQALSKLAFPPPFMEREALASRVVEMSPAGGSFRAPVLIEIPHFASTSHAERETIILRSDDGETWIEHVSDYVNSGEVYEDVVLSVKVEDHPLERIYDVLEVSPGRIIRILTSVFPKYFAIISRVREEVRSVGQEGGKVVLDTDPRLRATFPKNAVKKKIKVGLQTQSIPPEIVKAAFGRSVEVSRMVAVEPRKRKFHEPIFVSIPLPCLPGKASAANIRLLCSVTSSTEKASWQDVTGSTPVELCKDIVHFSTKVSGTFWLLVIHDKQREPEAALTLANRLYEEAILVPYQARLSVFLKENYPKAWTHTLRVYCMTDDKAEKVIQSLQGFRPLVISGDVEVPHSSPIAVRLGGNLMQLRQDPYTSEIYPTSTLRKGGDVKESFVFKAFEENCLTLLVQAKDKASPLAGSLSFARKLTGISATQQLPLCQLAFDFASETPGHCIVSQGAESVSVPLPEASSQMPLPPSQVKAPGEDEDPYEMIDISKSSTLRVKSSEVLSDQNLAEAVARKLDQHAVKKENQKQNVKDTKLGEGPIKKEKNNRSSPKVEKHVKVKQTDEKVQNGNSSPAIKSHAVSRDEGTPRSRSKAKKFSSEDLEGLRSDFASQQGVKEVNMETTPGVKEKSMNQIPSVNGASVSTSAVAKKSADIYITDAETPIKLLQEVKEDKLKSESKKIAYDQCERVEDIEEICLQTKAFQTTQSVDKTDRSRTRSKSPWRPKDNHVEDSEAPIQLKTEQSEIQTEKGNLQKEDVASIASGGKNRRSRSKSKAKKFAPDDLEALRTDFAKQQGVKEVVVATNLPVDLFSKKRPNHANRNQDETGKFEEIVCSESKHITSSEPVQKVNVIGVEVEKGVIRSDDMTNIDAGKSVEDIEKDKEEARLADMALWKPAPAPFELPESQYPPKMNEKLSVLPGSLKVVKPVKETAKQQAVQDNKVAKTKSVVEPVAQVSTPKDQNKTKSKQKKFVPDDLESLRTGYSNEQGVKEVTVYQEPKPEKQQQTSKSLGVEEVGEFEEIDSPEESVDTKRTKQRAGKEDLIADIVDDIKDMSSLKRKKTGDVLNCKDAKVTSLEQGANICGDTRNEGMSKEEAAASPSQDIMSSPHDNTTSSTPSSPCQVKPRDDDIIGFDIIKPKGDVETTIEPDAITAIYVGKSKGETETETEEKRLADMALWKPAPAPFELPESQLSPKPPARKLSLAQAFQEPESEPSLTSEQKEKRGSFVRDWQRDIKEFFSLGRKKKRKSGSTLSSKESLSCSDRINATTGTDRRTNGHSAKDRSSKFEKKDDIHDHPKESGKSPEKKRAHTKERKEEKKRAGDVDGSDEKELSEKVAEEMDRVNNEEDTGVKEASSASKKGKMDRRARRKSNIGTPTHRLSDSSPQSSPTEEQSIGNTGWDNSPGTDNQVDQSSPEQEVISLPGEASPRTEARSSILAIGGKPKVVVPSPKGIPKPRPLPKRDSCRDSWCSQDEDDLVLPLSPNSHHLLARAVQETENLALFSTRRNTYGEVVALARSNSRDVPDSTEEPEEFKKAVDSFDQLYKEAEKEEQSSSKKTKKNKERSKSSTAVKQEAVHEEESIQQEWKQIKRVKSCDDPASAVEPAAEENIQEAASQRKNTKKKRGRTTNNADVEKNTSGLISVDTEKVKALEEAYAAKSDQTGEEADEMKIEFSEVQKKIIRKTQEAQDTIQSTLIDMETERMEEVVRVQKHSLGVQDGVMVERKRISIIRTESSEENSTQVAAITMAPTEETNQIDPDTLKNVDGQAKARKGSSRFSKRQNSKSKSPRNSLTSETVDDVGDEDSVSNTDLTSRLAQTNERMKKLSATLEPSLMTREEWPEEEEVVVVSGRQQTSAHPLVRTTRIRVVDPLEGMIESMIHKPEDISSSSSDPCASSEGVEDSPIMYRAVVVLHPTKVPQLTTPHCYTSPCLDIAAQPLYSFPSNTTVCLSRFAAYKK